ncbi:MAG: hypothetical protein KGZ62_10870 [Sulfurimonas sp.]|nr:hypothetical protein [Sulfurimonas sp.]
MSLISKKYTILMNKEPLEVWINGGEVKSARFMGKRVQLNLDSEAIKLIKDNPTRYVNGSNLTDNLNFTQNVSKLLSSKLEYAMATGDKKTLSRFARSDLVPENQKNDFIAGINRPNNGLRGILTRAVNNTNAIFQNLAKKIDRFFDKIADKTANQTLDPHLKKYQLSYVNRAPPITEQDAKGYVDSKLMQLADEFHKEKGMDKRAVHFEQLADKILLNEFLERATKKGYDLKDSKLALYKVEGKATLDAAFYKETNANIQLNFQIHELEKKLQVYEQKEASKNETIEDFKTLSRDLDQSDRIDILIKNKEYQRMPEEQKRKVEDSHIFNHEPILQRAQELQDILEVVQSATPIVETVIDRTPTVDFLDKTVLSQINEQWQHQQTVNRQNATPTRDFMNISAVKFNGVSKDSLDRWGETAKSHARADAGVIDAFINASLRNANELLKIGVLKEVSADNFKFVDNFAKQSLYNNIDKTVAQIAEANQGKQVTREAHPQNEIKERLESITSAESFEKLVMSNGKIDPTALQEYTNKIVSLSAALHTEQKANVLTREDLRKDDQAHEQYKSRSQALKQEGGLER